MAAADRDALEAMFRSTGGDHWKRKTNWATDAELSTWHGVKVGEVGRVVELVRTENNLQGSIPEGLGALTNLTELNLHGNQLTGPIPEGLGALTNLAWLYLRNNQLAGPIPGALGALTNLTKLNLRDNQLTGPIPEELGALVNLMWLNLSSNQLTGPIPEALGALAKLTELNLYGNQLTGFIPEAVGTLTTLAWLNLSRNQLTGPIPEALGVLTNLTWVSLSNNQLIGPIPEAVGALITLKHLYLNDNQLTGLIPEALGALTNLKELHLYGNQLTGPIPGELGALTNLTKLFLGRNLLTGPIPETLGALTNLTWLDLRKNQLTGTVPLSMWKLPCVKMVDLSGNLLTQFTDAQEEAAPTRVVLDCIERIGKLSSDPDVPSGLFAEGNPWEFPPAAVVANGLESIRKYYDTWEQCDLGLVEIHALKIVFVGAYKAGKTSLARSMKMGHGDRTPEESENTRTTVGVDLHNHKLRNGTECKIYDVAGQITYYGLHQFFFTERAVYVIVCDATKFEDLSGKTLDEAIEEYILEWISLLHMRTPLCTVMLVASHYDLLHGPPEENEQLLVTVEERFLELHKEWKSLRDYDTSSTDARMTVLPGVFPVGCKLASESASCTTEDGLDAVDEVLSKQASMISRVPPSWVAARDILEQVGNTHERTSRDASAVDGRRRPWELRSVLYAKFKSFVEEGRGNEPQREGHHHPASVLSYMREDGIRSAMDGAIEMRAFSGTVISHDVFVVLDVMWLAGVLKPILDHRGVTKNKRGKPVYADRVLGTSERFRWASELEGKGILRAGFARFLWSLREEQATEGVGGPDELEPAKFEEILERMGVTIPLPVEEAAPPAEDAKSPEDNVRVGARRDGADLLVIMRLPVEADEDTRENLLLARQAAFPDDSSGEKKSRGLKAVFEFDHAGAPHGLPERVMALSHKIGVFSSRARWRLGGLFLLHDAGGVNGPSPMILEYDKKRKTLCIEALGQDTPHIQAVQFVISALYHVARDFPGASWMGWMGCGMSHDGEKMYLLATTNDKQNQNPGSATVPLIRDSPREEWSKQRNMCDMQGLDPRGPCTVDPDVFGRVLDVTQPFKISEAEEGRNTAPNPSTTSPSLSAIAGDVNRLAETMGQVKEGVARVGEGVQKIDEGIRGISRDVQQILLRLKDLQAPNYPYPHLVEVKEVQQAEGKWSLWGRLRGVFAKDVTLCFLCSCDMSRVPCGDGGKGYRLRKTRGWVKKVSPALQVTLVTVKVALRTVAGADVPGLSGFLQDFEAGLAEDFVDRTLDEDALLRVAAGDEAVGDEMRTATRASYEAIKQFMAKEEAKRRKRTRHSDVDYVDFRDSMEQLHDEKGGWVWVRTENVRKWKDVLPTAAPPT